MSEARAAPSSVSVVVVSDYEEAAEKTWHEERRILRGLADQDFCEPFTVILVETTMPEARALAGEIHSLHQGRDR
jgi:hypothetical protein